MESSYFSMVISQIDWVWFAFSVVAAFAVGAIWYSLIFFNTWRAVFKVDMPDQNSPLGWIRSFIVQFVTGTMLGLVCFVLASVSIGFAAFTVVTIAGWQMCTITFKYGDWKRFLQAVMIESGYTLACGVIYILFSQI
ncbi:DUF1761 domain-containing protein [Bacteroides sp. 51]|uniref:DUF1761 domain-containing protein n=1 Tax=Bacteroides sp. 51 TaxID=2302938 RepID=UPI00351AD6F0|nr:DUF1761 domain-containing protein [Bacteroides sp. 51]